jgi:hypothetical protein
VTAIVIVVVISFTPMSSIGTTGVRQLRDGNSDGSSSLCLAVSGSVDSHIFITTSGQCGLVWSRYRSGRRVIVASMNAAGDGDDAGGRQGLNDFGAMLPACGGDWAYGRGRVGGEGLGCCLVVALMSVRC